MGKLNSVHIPYSGKEVFFSGNLLRLIVDNGVIEVRSAVIHIILDGLSTHALSVPSDEEAYSMWLDKRIKFHLSIISGRFEDTEIIRSMRFILHQMKRPYTVLVEQSMAPDLMTPRQYIVCDFGKFTANQSSLSCEIHVHLARSAITQMIGACRTLLLNSITHEIQNAGLYDIRTPQVA